jgi:hypothetical protein
MLNTMVLFIDRLPLYAWGPREASSGRRLVSVSVPVIVTNRRAAPRRGARAQRWAVDTRFTGEAFAWRHHLLEAGLDPDIRRAGPTLLTPLGGVPLEFPVRQADLWLVSNIPALRDTPYCIQLAKGIAFRNVPSLPNPESNCPLLGMRALERAGLKILMDFARGTVSVWVPAAWYRAAWLGVRRLISGWATMPAPWPETTP